MKKLYLLFVTVLLVALIALTGCTVTNSAVTPDKTSPPLSSVTAPVSTSPVAAAALEGSLESIYERVNPAVVNISVLVKQDLSGLPFSGGGSPGYSSALGSGFLWDKQGHIVTNNHVIANAENITVTFSNGTEVPGVVIGADADSDLAVVKVNLPALDIQPVPMADSAQVKVGQIAIAIGNPFGLQGTMTVGIVSSVGRVLTNDQSTNAAGAAYSIPDVIQTDASINPGNSGGVLLDKNGSLIGVTYSIATTSGSSNGVGFAIPSEIVQKIVPALISAGKYQHPYIGSSILSLDMALNIALNLPSGQRGVLVESVASGGPADLAGLKAGNETITVNGQEIIAGGDIIIAYDGQSVKSTDDLISYIAKDTVGQVVKLTILRNGTEMQLSVTLGARPVS
jgi:S1-C subfamily serine protease